MTTLSYLAPSLATVHPGWQPTLGSALAPKLSLIDQELTRRSSVGETFYPPADAVFRALSFVAPSDVKVVILGQDPYHGAGEAMGLSFSVGRSVRVPPSLRNIYKELHSDLGLAIPAHGDLTHWAQQGVLLLNAALTVSADNAGSHGKLGWQRVTDALIDTVNRDNPGCVFILWGNWAQSKAERIDTRKHAILTSAHPSPLSARRGFFGSRPFSNANTWLLAHGREPVDWQVE